MQEAVLHFLHKQAIIRGVIIVPPEMEYPVDDVPDNFGVRGGFEFARLCYGNGNTDENFALQGCGERPPAPTLYPGTRENGIVMIKCDDVGWAFVGKEFLVDASHFIFRNQMNAKGEMSQFEIIRKQRPSDLLQVMGIDSAGSLPTANGKCTGHRRWMSAPDG
jgi:hypothetical protein